MTPSIPTSVLPHPPAPNHRLARGTSARPSPSRCHAEVMARGERWFGVPAEDDPRALEPALIGFTHGPGILETLRRRDAA